MARRKVSRAGGCHTLNVALVMGLAFGGLASGVRADQVEMKSGDRYVGSVAAVDDETVVLRSETLGALRLPRGKVSTISFGPLAAAGATNRSALAASAPLGAPARTNAAPGAPEMSKQLAVNSNLVQQVQAQFLAGAGPEATARFNELLGGLMNGKLSVGDIRAQARTAAEQLRAAKQELGDDAGFALDGYLAILDHFLKESDPGSDAAARPKTSGAAKDGGKAHEE